LQNYIDFVLGYHPQYARYYDTWKLAVRSYYGGLEFKDGNYLKFYDIDASTPSETINTYDLDDNGIPTARYKSSVSVNSSQEANSGSQYASNFYQEKLNNVSSIPYTRLYVNEYNSLLFNNPPVRNLPDQLDINEFILDVNGDQDSINEFWSHVDVMTTVFGVVWISCLKIGNSEYPKWKLHTPIDVTNWDYGYTTSGDLYLKEIVYKVADEEDMMVFHHITENTIETVFVPRDEDDTEFKVDVEDAIYFEEGNYFKTIQENELGYVPVLPVYQSSKIHNGVGHTPVFDIAQLCREVYNYKGEIYSAISYGAHPVTLVDEQTREMNGGGVGAEPGTLITVPNSLNGQPNFTFEFQAPPLENITQLRELIDQSIDKMNNIAMIRSDELIKASRSGAQIEMYDTKLEAFVRKKATSLENAEYNSWKIWFDWQEQDIPEDFSISYNRTYSKRGIEAEVQEISSMLSLLDTYKTSLMGDVTEYKVQDFPTEAEAEAEANKLGGTGTHSHTREDGLVTYMPFATHLEYELAIEQQNPGIDLEEDTGFEKEYREKLRERMKQIIDRGYSSNSL